MAMEQFLMMSCLLASAILVGLVACTNAQPSAIYQPAPAGIDALRPGCGVFKRHQSQTDSNGFGCVGGHQALPGSANTNSTATLTRRRRMAGGHVVGPEEAPHYAQIVGFFANGAALRNCGGTIIHKNLILVAAHCMVPLNQTERVGVVVGASEFDIVGTNVQHDGMLVYVEKHLIMPGWSFESFAHRDIALLKLAEDLEYSDRVQPACLRLESVPRNEANCFNPARGSVNTNNEFSSHLKGMPMEMDPGNLPEYHIFWWWPLVEGAICQGDSGSGLICYDSCDDSGAVRAHVVGVVTGLNAGSVCEERKQKGGYVNLHALRHDLTSMIDEILK